MMSKIFKNRDNQFSDKVGDYSNVLFSNLKCSRSERQVSFKPTLQSTAKKTYLDCLSIIFIIS